MNHYRDFKALVRRAVQLIRTEGVRYFARRTIAFAGYLTSRVVAAHTMYLYEHSLVARDRDDFLPRLDNWDLRIIHTNEDADRVVAEGFEDPRDVLVFASRSLRKGAVVFCVYVDTRLVHAGWLAVDARGKSAMDRMPYDVAFDSGQACTGGTYTVPSYRGRGLMSYVYFERFEYLRERGFTTSRNSVEVSNVASQRAHARFNPLIYGIGKYRKVLWWTSWRVEDLPGGPCYGMPPGRMGGRA